MDAIRQPLAEAEDALHRLLGVGWHAGVAELAGLARAADFIEGAGAPGLAGRLRAVATATGPSDAARKIPLALAALDLLRARLTTTADHAGWSTWKPESASAMTLLPLCRVATDLGEAWSCLRQQGRAVRWELTTPVPSIAEPWFGGAVSGIPSWAGRMATGPAADVDLRHLDGATGIPVDQKGALLHLLRSAVAGKVESVTTPHVGGGRVALVDATAIDADAHVWLSDTHRSATIAAAAGRLALLLDRDQGTIVIALVERPRLLRPGAVVHLVPGNPRSKPALR